MKSYVSVNYRREIEHSATLIPSHEYVILKSRVSRRINCFALNYLLCSEMVVIRVVKSYKSGGKNLNGKISVLITIIINVLIGSGYEQVSGIEEMIIGCKRSIRKFIYIDISI